ncbi:hypothetical protein [Ectopseudomonas toyotomiensis]|uniref:hypothetical protein n=1 Tax=Ectopseudomonas toyotomiensis TaxID=554344 RepID=UPI003132DE7C
MSTVHDPMKAPISLHGLGFIQVQLQAGQRLHVWHPELPRRRCFEHSAIHNHRFGFESQVLVGQQININYRARSAWDGEDATHRLYLHEGPRTENGGRPWTPKAPVVMVENNIHTIAAGEIYRMEAYDFHRTEPGGDGRVATLMTKFTEGKAGAMSSCRIGIKPDTDFDRFQLSPAQLWMYVIDVLSGSTAANLIAQAELELLAKVEQMAAYYEGPKGFFDWIDLQKAMRAGQQSGSLQGLNQPQQGGDQ